MQCIGDNMMKKEALDRQSVSYLIKLERWELIRWKRRLELLNETTNDLWLIREVLQEKGEIADKHFFVSEG
jgi:stalled ribosome rescue protein Dom34